MPDDYAVLFLPGGATTQQVLIPLNFASAGQRADYVHMKVALQTTFDRPIINTRDEPHADAGRFRRLHVIVGDANRMDVPRVLKLGTTSMLLWVCEHAEEAGIDLTGELEALTFADPVDAMHRVSHDLTLAQPLPMSQTGQDMILITD